MNKSATELRNKLSKTLYKHMLSKEVGPEELAHRLEVPMSLILEIMDSGKGATKEVFSKVHLYLGETEEFWIRLVEDIEEAEKDGEESRLKKSSTDWESWEKFKKNELEPVVLNVVEKYIEFLKGIKNEEDIRKIPKLGVLMAREYYAAGGNYQFITKKSFLYLFKRIKDDLLLLGKDIDLSSLGGLFAFVTDLGYSRDIIPDFLREENKLGRTMSEDLNECLIWEKEG